MNLYADYKYYVSEFGGDSINGNDFKKYSIKSQHLIDYYTQNRIDLVTDKVKNAICAVADILYEHDKISNAVPVGVKSERIDDVDITYESNNKYTLQEQLDKLIYSTLLRELSGTGLMYRGG